MKIITEFLVVASILSCFLFIGKKMLITNKSIKLDRSLRKQPSEIEKRVLSIKESFLLKLQPSSYMTTFQMELSLSKTNYMSSY